MYPDFKSTLQAQGVRACLPQLNDGDIEGGVKIYHSFYNYEKLAEQYQVVAFALGDVIIPPIKTLTRTQISELKKFSPVHVRY